MSFTDECNDDEIRVQVTPRVAIHCDVSNRQLTRQKTQTIQNCIGSRVGTAGCGSPEGT